MKVYDYKIVKAKNTEELSKDVTKQIAKVGSHLALRSA